MPAIEENKKEYEEILKKLSDPGLISDWPAAAEAAAGKEKLETLFKRKSFLEKVIAKEEELREIKSKIEENKAILSAKEDQELVSLAQEELPFLLKQQKVLEKEIKNLLMSEGKSEEKESVIIEIRAGTGGDEACLFAGDLFRMYSKYAQSQNLKQKILNSHPAEIGGFKEIIFELENGNVFSKMKYEGGVHRVQRIPQTEKSGRIHTSTASVAVLPKPKSAQIKISPQDIKIDFYRASGPGGQYVNKRESAVRITHLPTGIVVTCQSERLQGANREKAMKILMTKLYQLKTLKTKKELKEIKGEQVSASWGNQIRSYVVHPYQMVKDLRTGVETSNVEKVLDGNLDQFIEAEIRTYSLRE